MKAWFFLITLLSFTQKAVAGRPLITDDAGVIGKNEVQIETWLFSDKRSLQHWLVPTFGLGGFLEVSAAGVQGLVFVPEHQNTYSTSGPVLQAKLKLKDAETDGTPGFAVAGGTIPSFGNGYFKSPGWEYFYYLAATSFVTGTDKVLVHVNIGRQTQRQLKNGPQVLLWGIATEVRTSSKTHLFVEASNGEVYGLIPGVASQGGFRYDVTTRLQVDGTLGTGLSGKPRLPFWATVGFKYVSNILQ